MYTYLCKALSLVYSFQAFMQGKLKLTGNMALAMKLKELQLTAPSSRM